jgi:hypothetical protein
VLLQLQLCGCRSAVPTANWPSHQAWQHCCMQPRSMACCRWACLLLLELQRLGGRCEPAAADGGVRRYVWDCLGLCCGVRWWVLAGCWLGFRQLRAAHCMETGTTFVISFILHAPGTP